MLFPPLIIITKNRPLSIKSFKKPSQKLIKEILHGIQAAKDVKLSNIARTLKEKRH